MIYLFKLNKYNTWYFNIVNKAKSQDRKKKQGTYYENHHIIPKCLGGEKKKQNLVLLTAREHFICHWILCKIVRTRSEEISLIHAFYKMLTDKRNTARQYEMKRIYMSFIIKNKGRSEEHKAKISKANKGKILARDSEGNIFSIIKDDSRWISGELVGSTKGISTKGVNKGMVSCIDTTNNTLIKINKEYFDGIRYVGVNTGRKFTHANNKGKIPSDHTKHLLSLALIKSKWFNDGKINYRVKENQIPPEGSIPGRIKWKNHS